MTEKEPFTKVMRKATRGIHSVSDALINAKLGVAMTDNRVWAEGLLAFYEVFKHLEAAMDRLKDTVVEELDISGMRRTKAFEKDLLFYLGKDWKSSYPPNSSVVEYLARLSDLEKTQPTLLLAYIYHLYMGLFAGGQILRKKRAMVLKLTFSKADEMEGLAVVDVGGNVYKLKKQMSEAMNQIAETLNEETRQLLIEESKNVFLMNNKMVHSIKGTNEVFINMLTKAAIFIVLLAIIIYFIRSERRG